MPNAIQPPSEQRVVAGDAATLARRYAGALMELADQQKEIEAVEADLQILGQLADSSPEFRAVAAHPRLTRPQLVRAMQVVAAAAGFNKLTGNFLALVAQNRRLNVLGAVVDSFLADLAARRGEVTADVRAARALTPSQQDQLKARLQELVGGTIRLSIKEDAGLLGGLTVKLGSRLIDSSLKSKLQRLERQLKAGAAA